MSRKSFNLLVFILIGQSLVLVIAFFQIYKGRTGGSLLVSERKDFGESSQLHLGDDEAWQKAATLKERDQQDTKQKKENEALWKRVAALRKVQNQQDEDQKLWKSAEALLSKGKDASSSNNGKPKVGLLVLIKTGPNYFARRESVRSLWVDRCRRNRLVPPSASESSRSAAKAFNVSCLFVTGQSESADVRRKVDEEVHGKGDLFSAPVPDGYNTMTTKTQWILLWSLLDASRFYDYVLLIDDDAFVAFTTFLPWLSKQPRRGFYAGHQHFARGVYRCDVDPGHPNCVPRDMYPEDSYPPFASGFGYIMSRDVAKLSVLRAIVRTRRPGLPGNVEDAMVGVLLREAGVQMRDDRGFVHWADESHSCPRGVTILLIGNAPEDVLRQLRENEQNGAALCHNLP